MRSSLSLGAIGTGALALALAACSSCREAESQAPSATPSAPAPPVVPRAFAPASFSELVKQSLPMVVNIYTTAMIKQAPVAYFPFGEDSPFYQLVQPPAKRSKSLGSGFIISYDGDILTNNHVVAPEELSGRTATEITVQLADRRSYKARIVARDPATDLALLHIDAAGLTPAKLGDSDTSEVGDWVVAIGQPYGLSSSVTAGIISAKGRHGRDIGGGGSGYYDFIQTDTAVNPGNSGGPLVNMKGEVIGINTAINAKGQGLAFAVPINMAKRVLGDFKKFGKVQRAWAGWRVVDPKDVDLPYEAGAVVAQLVQGGPAHKAGLKPGDLVLGFNGTPIEDAERLRFLTAEAGAGRQVILRVRRGQYELDVPVITGESP